MDVFDPPHLFSCKKYNIRIYLGVCGGENSPYTVSSSSVMLVYSCIARSSDLGAPPTLDLPDGAPVAPPVASQPDC